MGFSKRYVKRDMIMNSVDNLSYISNLVNADALILDNWSNKFFKNFNFKWKDYNKIREGIINDTKFDSHHNGVVNHVNYKKLFSLSNILLNLKTNPSWVDIQLSDDILTPLVPEEYSGNFNKLVDFYIDEIEDYYN